MAADIKSRADVLAMGIDKYNEECRSIVMRYSKVSLGGCCYPPLSWADACALGAKLRGKARQGKARLGWAGLGWARPG